MTRLGAWVSGDGVEFCVWAPAHEHVEVVVRAPVSQRVAMAPDGAGYHSTRIDGIGAGARYRLAVGERELPDPASRAQPDDVHGDSEVVAPSFVWSDDAWCGLPLAEYVCYELHVGTFTPAGTFDAAIERLGTLRDLGITAIEVMPVAEFPGARNWGYDGVFPYAVESSYGGADAFRRFVDASHAAGLAIVLDVVYNHLGPEGSVLGAFGPYFTDRYHTPWGDALNFDGPGSDHVRRFFIDNACEWVADYHVDALRLDAVHAIVDSSAYPFVEELTDAVHEVGRVLERAVYVIAESAANDARLITPQTAGGLGCDAQWSDDFHHALHALLTGERHEYYADYGEPGDLATAYREGFVYANRHSIYRDRRHGRPAAGLPGTNFVVCAENHDQIGNRAAGDRLVTQAGFDSARLAAAAVVCAPFVPLLFMGEEYGAGNPFPYFVSHTDPELVEAVREGRRREFGSLAAAEVPDPQDPATFASAVLDWSDRDCEPHASMLAWYRSLLALRARRPALRNFDLASVTTHVFDDARALAVARTAPGDDVMVVLAFAGVPHDVVLDLGAGRWTTLLDTHPEERGAGTEWAGAQTTCKAPPRSALILGAVA